MTKARQMTIEEISSVGNALFELNRKALERKHMGEYVVFDLSTGRYTLGPTLVDATNRHREQFAEAPRFTRHISAPDRTVTPIRRVPEVISLS
jgi:hypothetical protein